MIQLLRTTRLVRSCLAVPAINFPDRTAMPSRIRTFLRNESGIAVTEYGLLIALIAVLLIGVVTIFGSSISSWFANKTNKITSF
jgi:pilus assembly protein Flp/PilA